MSVDRLPRDVSHGTAHQKLQEATTGLVDEPEPGGAREVREGGEVAVQPVDQRQGQQRAQDRRHVGHQ